MDIREEVLSRPDCAEAYAAKDCHELARLLSIGLTKIVPVLIGDVQSVLQRTGEWWAIMAIPSDSPAYPAAVAVTDAAKARYSYLHLDLPIVAQMFDALMVSGALSQAVTDEIMALSVVPDSVSQREVAVACYHDNGEPI